MKNVVECPIEFFAYFNALETRGGVIPPPLLVLKKSWMDTLLKKPCTYWFHCQLTTSNKMKNERLTNFVFWTEFATSLHVFSHPLNCNYYDTMESKLLKLWFFKLCFSVIYLLTYAKISIRLNPFLEFQITILNLNQYLESQLKF